MLEARLQKAARLLRLQRSLQRIEEDRVAQLRRRQSDLATQQEEIVAVLNRDDGLQDMLMPVSVRRLRSLGEEARRVAEELERRTRILQAAAARTKYVERLSLTYEQQVARSRAEKELLEVIERTAGPKDASLP